MSPCSLQSTSSLAVGIATSFRLQSRAIAYFSGMVWSAYWRTTETLTSCTSEQRSAVSGRLRGQSILQSNEVHTVPGMNIRAQDWSPSKSGARTNLLAKASSSDSVVAAQLRFSHEDCGVLEQRTLPSEAPASDRREGEGSVRSRQNLHVPGAPSTLPRQFDLERAANFKYQPPFDRRRGMRSIHSARWRAEIARSPPHGGSQKGVAEWGQSGGGRSQSAAARMQGKRILESALETVRQQQELKSDWVASELDEILDSLNYQLLPGKGRDLDWSGGSNTVGLPEWSLELAQFRQPADGLMSSIPQEVTIKRNDQPLTVRPIWIAVHQEEEYGTARLYDCTLPLDDKELAKLPHGVSPLLQLEGLNFRRNVDLAIGAWWNFFVGVCGDVGPAEEDVLWPNQVIHGDRTMYNVRGVEDIGHFLADPVEENIKEHLSNLLRLQEERHYSPGWAYELLTTRWGRQPLGEMGIIH